MKEKRVWIGLAVLFAIIGAVSYTHLVVKTL